MKSKYLLSASCLLLCTYLQAQKVIGSIDIYGNRKTSSAVVAQAIPLKVGDTIQQTSFNHEAIKQEIRKRLGIAQVQLDIICCTVEGDHALFVGIGENTRNTLTYRKPPTKQIKLPTAMSATYDSLMNTFIDAVKSGQAHEDYFEGYSLVAYPPARALQKQMVNQARQYPVLQNVLRQAVDAKQRAAAAYIIAYAADKQAIVKDLLYAVTDPDDDVRNNATRALGILALYGQEHPETKLHIPAAPFIRMLNSLVWTDRNKGASVLYHLSSSRSPELFRQLKQEALPSLIEMALWKSKDHAGFAFFILARMAGLKEDDLFGTLYSKNFHETLDDVIKTIQNNN